MMNHLSLAELMAQIPEPVTDKFPPHWEYWRQQLWNLAKTQDPRDFYKWPCIFHTMLQDHWPQVPEWEAYQMVSTTGVYPADVTAPEIGPRDYLTRGTPHSRNLVRQLYHLYFWEQTTDRKISDLTSIVEIGGGYGAMALMASRMGFKGKYVIYDLPEFSRLQRWYLAEVGLPEVECTTVFPLEPISCDLLVGIYSLSEMEFAWREQVLNYFKGKSSLFLYSGKWEDYDNVTYFQRTLPTFEPKATHYELTHIPDRNNWYTILY